MEETPKHIRLARILNSLSDLRHEIFMLKMENKLWEDWLSPLEGGLTCVISYGYEPQQEMKKYHEKYEQ